MQCSAAAQQVAQREACGARVRRSGAMVCVVSAVSRRVAEQSREVVWLVWKEALDVARLGDGRSRVLRPGH
jgi:hypothetical protein